MRPIDADILIPLIQEDKIEGKTLGIIKALGDGPQAETLNQACDRHIRIIQELSTIDAVPVVRCKDCKHFHYNKPYGILMMNLVCDKWGEGCRTNPDGYCFMGERKDDE